MIKLRLKRMGRRHRPYYRIGAMDVRSQRDGKMIEQLGHYDPLVADDQQISLDAERAKYWLSQGAQPTETVADILRRSGIDVPGRAKAGKKAVAAPAEAPTAAPAPEAQQ